MTSAVRCSLLLLALGAGACGAPSSPPSAPSDHGEQVAPSRESVVAYARRYVALEWTASTENVFHGTAPDGVPIDTPDEPYVRGGWRLGPNVGVAYSWGGFDTPEDFLRKIARGRPAGHAARNRASRATWYAAGVDCSGLVSRAWGFTHKRGTREFERMTIRLSHADELLPGDIMNKESGHVLLFLGFSDDSRIAGKFIEAGAWDGRAWRVVESEYAFAKLEENGFVPLRDARRNQDR